MKLPFTLRIVLKKFAIPPLRDTSTEIEDYLNAQTWGRQANVFFDVVNVPEAHTVPYDTNGVSGLSNGSISNPERDQILSAITSDDAEHNIYIVSKIEPYNGIPVYGYHVKVDSRSRIFIQNSSNLGTLGHEIGHALGIADVDSQKREIYSQDSKDIMAGRSSEVKTHVRRHDWNTVNPTAQ